MLEYLESVWYMCCCCETDFICYGYIIKKKIERNGGGALSESRLVCLQCISGCFSSHACLTKSHGTKLYQAH